jgi:hypothetical protein
MAAIESSASVGFLGFMKKLQKWVMPVLLVVMLACFVPLPRSASANDGDGDASWIAQAVEKVKKAIEKVSWLKTLFSWISTIFDLLNKMLDLIDNTWNAVGKVINAGQEAVLNGKVEIAQARSDNKTKDTETKSMAQTVAKNPDPMALQMLLCNMIILRVLELQMSEFANQIARIVQTGLPLDDMGAGANGDTQYDFENYSGVCGESPIPNAPPTGSRVDGYTETCVPGNTGAGGEIEDMHQMGLVLGRRLPLTVPTFEPQTIDSTGQNYLIAAVDPTRGSQQRWAVAAFGYLRNFAGRKPTPPNNVKAETRAGRRVIAQYNHCTTLRNGFTWPASLRLGALSRPDCANDDFSALCQSAQAACSAAQKGGVDVPDSFDNCQAGLSLVEIEELSRIVCLATARSREVMMENKTIDKFQQATEASDFCAGVVDSWTAQRKAEDDLFQRAGMLSSQLQTCWGNYSKAFMALPKSAFKEPPKDDPNPRKLVRVRPSLRSVNGPKVIQIKARRDLDAGEAVYADDLLVPASAP